MIPPITEPMALAIPSPLLKLQSIMFTAATIIINISQAILIKLINIFIMCDFGYYGINLKEVKKDSKSESNVF